MDLLDEGVVQAFGDAVIFGSIMDYKAVDCPLVVKVLIEFSALIFTTSITAEAFDFDIVLGVSDYHGLSLGFSYLSINRIIAMNFLKILSP